MKKVIFALAAVVALAACSQEDVIVADKGAAIGFDTFVENSTRSVYDPSYTNSSMFSDFAVYGYVNGAVLLDGVRVAKNGADMDADDYAGQTNTDWKYEGTQYWIAGANYNFNAVAPKTNGGWTKVDDGTNKDATKLKFTNNGTTDLLYAYATALGANEGNKEVKFNFRHVLSKVKFSFENAYNATNATIRVENVKIHDAYASGSVVLDDETVWTPVTTGDMLELDFGKATDNAATTTDKEAVDVAFAYGKTYESYNELLMIPGQGASTYTVTNADNTTTEYKNVYKVTFDVVLLVSGQKIDTYKHTIYTTFAPLAGMRYNLKAVIDATNIDPEHAQEPIEFTVNPLTDWGNGNTADDATDKDSESTTLK